MYHTRLTVRCQADFVEIMMAEIAEAGFDTFLEVEGGFEAYAEDDKFDDQKLQEIKDQYSKQTTITYSFDQIQKKNWNEEWEKSYEPINVDDRCLIRAEFHKSEKKFPLEIIITPKMSFGTGHHQTTYLMVKSQLDIDHRGKRVMDAGCGTAILSIVASKQGAREVQAFDIDEWSMVNGRENAAVNDCENITIQQGTIRSFSFGGKFDILLANINKNVLLDEMEVYQNYLADTGVLLLSGFYTTDIPDLIKAANRFGLKEVKRDERERWATLLLGKNKA